MLNDRIKKSFHVFCWVNKTLDECLIGKDACLVEFFFLLFVSFIFDDIIDLIEFNFLDAIFNLFGCQY